MIISFNKYQGTGNDFIIIDNRDGNFDPGDNSLVNKLCDRRFGIGADGLMLISDHPELDYEMRYYNSDGREGTMCGNGGRCAASFALKCGIAGESQRFMATDGMHRAEIKNNIISLLMQDVKNIRKINGNYVLNTGSPHYVIFRDDVDSMDVYGEGKKLRWSEDFAPGGTNVNFVRPEKNCIYVRTFERGVEDETLSCGTGVTASAIAAVLSGHYGTATVPVKTRGGDLSVSFKRVKDVITDIWLTGPGTFVFEGKTDSNSFN
jgi:diaminopimelate epimerase